MNLRIDEADLSDPLQAAATVDIIAAYARGPGGGNAPLSEHARDHMVEGLAAHPMMTVYLAFVDDRPVGIAVCAWTFSTFAGKPSVNVHDLAVLDAFQGQGIGGALLGHVEHEARGRDCAKMTLEVHDSNTGAKKLYRKVGFGPWDPPTWFVSKPL